MKALLDIVERRLSGSMMNLRKFVKNTCCKAGGEISGELEKIWGGRGETPELLELYNKTK